MLKQEFATKERANSAKRVAPKPSAKTIKKLKAT
jgi:hypothetical protein